MASTVRNRTYVYLLSLSRCSNSAPADHNARVLGPATTVILALSPQPKRSPQGTPRRGKIMLTCVTNKGSFAFKTSFICVSLVRLHPLLGFF